METQVRQDNENRKGLEEGDLVIFLESWGNVGGRQDIRTTKYVFSRIAQVSFNGYQVKLREPGEQTENLNQLNEGSTVGFVEDSDLVLPTKVDKELFKPTDVAKLERYQNVRIRVGVKGDKAYVVDGVFAGKLPDQDMYVVDVRNEKGLEAKIFVLPENICKSSDLDVVRTDRILAEEATELMVQLWREINTVESFPGHYDYTGAMRIARDWPALTKEYLDLIRKTKDEDSCLALIEGAPHYAKVLRPIFDECPRLLPVYAKFASSLPKDGLAMSQDKRYGNTRISTVCSVEAIRKHLDEIKKIEFTLNNILGDKESVLVATPFDGLAEVYLERMRFSMKERDGIYLLVRSPGGDFSAITRRIHTTGIVNSAHDFYQLTDIGYLLKSNYEMDEVEFLEALCKFNPMSEELNKALEESGAKDGNQYGKFEEYVIEKT